MAANIAYTLGSIPLALHYLDKERFGLWTLVMQIVGYLSLLDLGISQGLSRTLIDYKDDRNGGAYGSMLLTGLVAQSIIGGVVFFAGIASANFLGNLLHVPSAMQADFVKLVVIQSLISGVSIAARMLSAPLYAHQRNDLANLSYLGLFAVMFVSLWIGLLSGLGLYAMVLTSACGLIWGLSICYWMCSKTGLYPASGHWGRPSRTRFRELFSFSKDVFLMQVGAQILNGAPALLAARFLGLDAAATWAICTKTFTLLQQAITRPYEFAVPALAEMYARGERERLGKRFRDLLSSTTAVGCLLAAACAASNQAFIALWTNGRIAWPATADAAAAVWVVTAYFSRSLIGLSGVAKSIGILRYAYFGEALVLIGITALLVPALNLVAIPVGAALASLLVALPFGVYRSREVLQTHASVLSVDWMRRPVIAGAGAASIGMVVHLVFAGLPPLLNFFLTGGVTVLIGGLVVWFYGLDPEVKRELAEIVLKQRGES